MLYSRTTILVGIVLLLIICTIYYFEGSSLLKMNNDKPIKIEMAQKDINGTLVKRSNLPMAAYEVTGTVQDITVKHITVNDGSSVHIFSNDEKITHIYNEMSSDTLKSIGLSSLERGNTVRVEVVVKDVYERIIVQK